MFVVGLPALLLLTVANKLTEMMIPKAICTSLMSPCVEDCIVLESLGLDLDTDRHGSGVSSADTKLLLYYRCWKASMEATTSKQNNTRKHVGRLI